MFVHFCILLTFSLTLNSTTLTGKIIPAFDLNMMFQKVLIFPVMFRKALLSFIFIFCFTFLFFLKNLFCCFLFFFSFFVFLFFFVSFRPFFLLIKVAGRRSRNRLRPWVNTPYDEAIALQGEEERCKGNQERFFFVFYVR